MEAMLLAILTLAPRLETAANFLLRMNFLRGVDIPLPIGRRGERNRWESNFGRLTRR